MQRSRRRQLVHLEAPPAGIARRHEPLECILRYPVLRVVRISAPGQADLTGTRKAGQVIDVTGSFIGDHALTEPDHTADPEIPAQLGLNLPASQGRVSIAIEQTLFGNQHRPLSIDVNRSAFVDHGRAITRCALELQYLLRHGVIERTGPVQASPGIENPIHAAQIARTVDQKTGPDVTHPGIVTGELEHAHAGRQLRTRTLVLARADADGNGFKTRDRRCHRGKGTLRRQRPRAPIVGPLGP